MNSLAQDLRFAWRVLWKSPGFTLVAVTVLALGIGANTVVFGLANGLLLHPLYGRRSGELVGCFNQNKKRVEQYRPVSYPNYEELRDRNRVFAGLAGHKPAMAGLRDGETLRRLGVEFITANYFAVLGANVSQGRAFTLEEEKPGSAAPVVIVSHQYWMRTGADPGLVGKRYVINGQSYTVVGITPEGFTGHLPYTCPDLWLPLGMYDAAALRNRNTHFRLLLGQLKPGLTAAKANPELRVLADGLGKEFPSENQDYTFVASPLSRLYDSAGPARPGEIRSASVS